MIGTRVRSMALCACSSLLMLSAGCGDDEPASTPTPEDTGEDGAGGGKPTSTLYDRLGRKVGIASLIDAVFVEEMKDPDIASYYVYNDGAHPGHPSVEQIKECFVLLVGQAAGGPEVYPATVSGGFTCRSIAESHANTRIPHGIFEKFVAIGVAAMKNAGVADADLALLGAGLSGTEGDVVDPDAEEGPFQPEGRGTGGSGGVGGG